MDVGPTVGSRGRHAPGNPRFRVLLLQVQPGEVDVAGHRAVAGATDVGAVDLQLLGEVQRGSRVDLFRDVVGELGPGGRGLLRVRDLGDLVDPLVHVVVVDVGVVGRAVLDVPAVVGRRDHRGGGGPVLAPTGHVDVE